MHIEPALRTVPTVMNAVLCDGPSAADMPICVMWPSADCGVRRRRYVFPSCSQAEQLETPTGCALVQRHDDLNCHDDLKATYVRST